MKLENAQLHVSGRIFFARQDGNAWFVQKQWANPESPAHIWLIPAQDGESTHLTNVALSEPYLGGDSLSVLHADVEHHVRYPHADVLGNGFVIDVPGHPDWADTMAAFYWETLLPCVVERSSANFPDGYVLSTLQTSVYGGTYPDVDHEFQCKGRIAMGGGFDLDLVGRMIDLQCRLMREDPAGLWRVPCALQANDDREYHVQRNSMDGKVNAEMFLITGNVEVIENAWLYYAMRKDVDWLKARITDLEGAAWLTESLLDRYDRLWSDVYYEDQVMKDGSECMSAALAANAFGLLAEMETLLGRQAQAQRYLDIKARMAARMVEPTPMGFWDPENARFIDWLDRAGKQHDHIHLLANELPVLFGYSSAEQTQAVSDLVEKYMDEFQRFPTFMSARIQDYTDDEIGDGGPYDLCAAGRYWCWDAAYWHFRQDGNRLETQLAQLSQQAQLDNYRMGERYDMNYVYYLSDINWHGAAHYYEYPNVYIWTLIHEYLGLRPDLEADFLLRPLAKDGARIALETQGIAYAREGAKLRIRNLRAAPMKIKTDLSCIGGGKGERTLAPGEEWLAE